MRILAIEPFYGGSHKQFLDGLCAHSEHEFDLFCLPARKWKWRMRGAALNFAEMLDAHDKPIDLVLVSDYLALADLIGLRPERMAGIPTAVYFHENQLTYPVQEESERDYQFAFTNIMTCLTADRVFFNSDFHRTSFLDALGPFLARMPDCRPGGIVERIKWKSETLPLGVDLSAFDAYRAARRSADDPALILWNHRWEYDKNPEEFFSVLLDLAESGLRFDVAVAGETFRSYPPIFDEAKERLGERVVQFGYLPSEEAYARLLWEADIVVSTAIHEFFGIAVVEAMYCDCFPLLPKRLSYPELIPEALHKKHLYTTPAMLKRRLDRVVRNIDATRASRFSDHCGRFAWERIGPLYDRKLAEVAGH